MRYKKPPECLIIHYIRLRRDEKAEIEKEEDEREEISEGMELNLRIISFVTDFREWMTEMS